MSIQYYVPAQAQYQPQFFQAMLEVMIGLAFLVMIGAFAISQVRKAIKGEEVTLPTFLGG